MSGRLLLIGLRLALCAPLFLGCSQCASYGGRIAPPTPPGGVPSTVDPLERGGPQRMAPPPAPGASVPRRVAAG